MHANIRHTSENLLILYLEYYYSHSIVEGGFEEMS